MEHEADKGNDKHVRINFEVSYKEAEPLTWGSTDSSSSSDSSSLDLNFGENDLLSISHLESEQTGYGMEKGISSPIGSSPVQVMGKPSGYDPNRIPAFVFSGKPATAMEWSVASNESLFSLHMGNNSFSKDLPILLAKSQELGMLDGVTNFPFSLPPVTETSSYTVRETVHSRKSSGGTEASTDSSVAASTDSSVAVSMETSEERRKPNLPPSVEGRESDASSHSDGLAGEEQRTNFVNMEVDSEKQKSQPQTPRATSNAAGRSWFSCFSCFSCRPRCC